MQKLLFLLLFFPLWCMGKDYQIKLHIKNLPANSKPNLLKIFNGNMYVLDSMPVREQETLTFTVPANNEAGMLRTILGIPSYAQFMGTQQQTVFDFIFNNENVEIALDFNNPEQSAEVIQSQENKLYFDFLKKDINYFQKLGILEQVVSQYPDKDEFYHQALNYYTRYQQEREAVIDSTYKAAPQMLATRIINTRRMPYSPGGITNEQRDSIFKSDFLKKIEFIDTSLLYTNIYTDKIFQYINLFFDRQLGPRENEAKIIQVLDKIMPQISVNEEIKNQLLQFMISGFESMKMEEVLAHISANYLQQCSNTSMELIKRRLEGYKKMAIGQKVPDVLATDANNNPVSLYADVTPYTLLIFWHTECGHCQALMNELPGMVQKDIFQQHNVKIITISIDENRKNWEDYSQQHQLNWTNAYVEGSFSSDAANDFNLFATPTMFLLDNEHTIIAKPITLQELQQSIENLK